MTGSTPPSRRGRRNGHDLSSATDSTAADGHPGFADLLRDGPRLGPGGTRRRRGGLRSARSSGRSYVIGPHDGGPGTNDLGGDLDGDEQLSTPARRGFGLLVLAVIAATAVAVLSPQGMAYANTLLHRWLP